MMNEIKKYMGQFQILENGIFSENDILYSRYNNKSGCYDLYGVKNKLTGKLELFKPQKPDNICNYIPLNEKTFNRIFYIYLRGNDSRVNELYEKYISDFYYYNFRNDETYKTYVMNFYNSFNLK